MYLIVGLIVAIFIFFLLVMVIDTHRFVIRRYNIDDQKIKADTKIVFLTDLHGVRFGKNNSKLLEAIDNEKPDYVLIGGDLYTASNYELSMSIAIDLLKELTSKYKVIYTNGNHELKTKINTFEYENAYEMYINKACSMGVSFLNNAKLLIDNNICIYGLDLPFEYYKKSKNIDLNLDSINEMLDECNSEEFSMLLAHNPEYFSSYALWGADLTLSGHFHGGLLRIPGIGGFISPKYILFPKYSYGEYEENGKKMILSCGLGFHTLPIRIFNPGELSVINLRNKQ